MAKKARTYTHTHNMGVKSDEGNQTAEVNLIDAGCDYIRLTSAEARRQKDLFWYFEKVALRDSKLGYEPKPGGAFGFYGKKTRHALWGVKGDWAMVQASGYEAKGALALAKTNVLCSRIDIQMTWRLPPGTVGKAIGNAYNEACGMVRPKGRPLAVKLIEERHVPQTLYVGKRASDIYVRIYDKEAESGTPEYADCIRMEVELKGRAAKALWQKVTENHLGISDLLSLLLQILKERGITPPTEDFEAHDIIKLRRVPTRDENTIAWLARQVAPTVQRLSDSYGWFLQFSVLFDKALTEHDKRHIISLLAKVWGT